MLNKIGKTIPKILLAMTLFVTSVMGVGLFIPQNVRAEGEDQTLDEVMAAFRDGQEGNQEFKLWKDFTITNSLVVPGNTNTMVDLNGHTLTFNCTVGIKVNGNLTIRDSSASQSGGLRLSAPFTSGSISSLIYIENDGHVVINSGRLYGPGTTFGWDGITMAGGLFEMSGGSLSGFHRAIRPADADTGAGVKMIFNGGLISGNGWGVVVNRFVDAFFEGTVKVYDNAISNVELGNQIGFGVLADGARIVLSFDSDRTERFLAHARYIEVSKEVPSEYISKYIFTEKILGGLDVFGLENRDGRLLMKLKIVHNPNDTMVGTRLPTYVYGSYTGHPLGYATMADYVSANPSKANEWTLVMNQDGTGKITLSGYQNLGQREYSSYWYNYGDDYILNVPGIADGKTFVLKLNDTKNAYMLAEGSMQVYFQKPGAPEFKPVDPTPTPVGPSIYIPLVGDNYSSIKGEMYEKTFVVSPITREILDKTTGDTKLTKTLTFDLTAIRGYEVDAIEIPLESIKVMGDYVKGTDNPYNDVELKFNQASLQMDGYTLSSVAGLAKGSTLIFTVKEKSLYSLNSRETEAIRNLSAVKAYDFSLVSRGEAIPYFQGNIRVNMNFTPESGRSSAYYHIYHVSESQAPIRCETYYKNGRLSFDASHFSTYIIAYSPSKVNESDNNVVRVFNPKRGDHILTKNVRERKMLVESGWVEEGLSFFASVSGKPIYRLLNERTGDHVYSASEAEVANCRAHGWTLEGVAFICSGSNPVYRLFNPRNGRHHHTTNIVERDILVGRGWSYEGIGFYVD